MKYDGKVDLIFLVCLFTGWEHPCSISGPPSGPVSGSVQGDGGGGIPWYPGGERCRAVNRPADFRAPVPSYNAVTRTLGRFTMHLYL